MQLAHLISRLVRSDALSHGFVRQGFGTAVLRVATILASLGASTVLARTLGPTGFGVYAYAMAILTIFALPVSMGLPTLILRETAAARATEDYPRMKGIFMWSSRLILITSCIMIMLGFLILWVLGMRFDPDTKLTVVFGLLLIPVTALGRARGAALRGLHFILQGQFPEDVLRPALLALFVAVMVWGFSEIITPARAMGLHLIAALIAFVLGYWLLIRARPNELASTQPSYDSPAWRGAILPLATISGLQIISQQTDLVMLGFWRAPEEIGFYKVAVSGAALTTFGLAVLNMLLAPRFAGLNATGDTSELTRLAAWGAVLSVLFTLPMVLLFASFGAEILNLLYGPAYKNSTTPLVIISIGLMLTASLGLTGTFISMSGLERFAAIAWSVATLLNVTLNAWAIPRYGMNGAALATMVSSFTASGIMWAAILSRTGIDVSVFGALRRH